MLTDMNWLKMDEPFPPLCEISRLEMYANNRALFESEHAKVYAEQLKRIERVIGNFEDVISYPLILNFQKKMTLKIADLLFGEPPIITAGEKGSAEQITVDTILENSSLVSTSYMNAIDVSRYGNGLFYVRLEDGAGIIDLSTPHVWFPIVSCDNVRKITAHVIAWVVGDILKVMIHTKGVQEEREYHYGDGKIGAVTKAPLFIHTGMKWEAIIPVSNTITSDRCTGMDDYTDIDSIISELIVRVGQIERILDKHANPNMQGPPSALEKDPQTGEWRVKAGNYFVRNSKEEPGVEYVVWEAALSANFSIIERLVNFLYTISEMGSAVFGDMSASSGTVPSGSALRRLMMSPLAKVNRIRMQFDPAIKRAIVMASQLGGPGMIDLTNTPITITWQDGLPGDPVEEAAIMASRTAQKATMSIHRALRTYDAMSDEDAEEELARIEDENSASAPIITPPFSDGTPSEPVVGEVVTEDAIT